MFENATDLVQKQLPQGEYPGWVSPVIVLIVLWIIFLVIREIWCWFFKTTAISSEVKWINLRIDSLQQANTEIKEELSKANAKLDCIAESATTTCNRSGGSRGN